MPTSPGYIPLSITPTGGLNTEMNPALIDDTEVQLSNNWLYENGLARTRPGVTAFNLNKSAITNYNGLTWFGQELGNGGQLYQLAAFPTTVGTNVTLASVDVNGVATALTGPQLVGFGSYGFGGLRTWPTIVPVNGNFMIPQVAIGAAETLIEWTPGAASYTQITSNNVAPRYLVGCLSRAVGAYDSALGAGVGPITVEWSVAGDETTWTGATNGSGSAVLSDASDGITGLGVINGTLVIPRYTGIHLGIQTGQAFPAFRFVNYNQSEGVGCYYPGTFATYNNTCYFVARDNVYSFDTINPPIPIGSKIISYLQSQFLSGEIYIGFVSTFRLPTAAPQTNYTVQRGSLARAQYHLVPLGQSVTNPLHFVYDITEGKWSVHNYSVGPLIWNYAFAGINTALGGGFIPASPAFIINQGSGGNASIWIWQNTAPCEAPAAFTSKSFRIGDYTRDYQLARGMLNYRSVSTLSSNTSVTIQGNLNSQNVAVVGSGSPNTKYLRTWFDGTNIAGSANQVYGNDVTVALQTAASSATDMVTDNITLQFVESGTFNVNP